MNPRTCRCLFLIFWFGVACERFSEGAFTPALGFDAGYSVAVRRHEHGRETRETRLATSDHGCGLSLPRRKVLVIGVDGLRPSALERAMTQGLAPNLAELAEAGTYCWNSSTSDLTFSGPGWTDLLAGVHRDQHLVETNSVTGNKFSNSNQHAFPDFLALCKSLDPTIRTARWTTWSPLSVTRTPGGTDYNFFREYAQNGDQLVTDDAVRFFREDQADVSFFYLGDVDIQGHASGFHPRIGSYLAEISTTDQLIGEVLDSIRARPGYIDGREEWLFIVCTDHGGNLGRGHSGNRPWDRRTFLIVSGVDAIPQKLGHGGHGVDVVPTVLQFLGLDQPPHLVGRAIGLSIDPRPSIALNRNLLLNGDAEFDYGFREVRFDQAVSGWNEFPDADFYLETALRIGSQSVTAVKYGSPGFPASHSPGPEMRGSNFFTGADAATITSMTQTLDLNAVRAWIDGRRAGFSMAAYLGGVGSQVDRAELVCSFRNEDGQELARYSIGPVTANERNQTTGLLYRATSGYVPPETATVDVSLHLLGRQACADNLVFQLHEAPTFPDVVAFDTFDDLTLLPFVAVPRTGDGTDFCNDIPGWTIDLSNMASPSSEPAYDGVTAMDVDSWISEQGAQIGRGSTGRFKLGQRNTALVFDPDAWADFSGAEERGYNASISRRYRLPPDVVAATLSIDCSWEFAAEASQTAIIDVSFDDGQTWQRLLTLDSEDMAANQILGDRSRFRAGIDFVFGGSDMLLRFAVSEAGNNWWFIVDDVTISDSQGVIEVEDFEGLPMQPYTVANRNSPSDGSDYTADIPGWTIDNSGMLQVSREPAYQGWRVLDVESWVEEQNGQSRSVLLTTGNNQALVADPDAWADYIPGAPGRGFNSRIYRDVDLRGFRPESLSIYLDWEFRAEAQQRGLIEISFDAGQTYQTLLDLDSADGNLVTNGIYFGPSLFEAGVDFVPSSYRARLRISCEQGGNNWWFALDNIVWFAEPTTMIAGDANGDGSFDFGDIEPFVLALTDPEGYLASFPGIDPNLTLDMNLDGSFDFGDIDGFVALLQGE
jgi:hypothetical protein